MGRFTRLGVNTNFLESYISAIPLRDVLKVATPWVQPGTRTEVDLDLQGRPTAPAECTIFGLTPSGDAFPTPELTVPSGVTLRHGPRGQTVAMVLDPQELDKNQRFEITCRNDPPGASLFRPDFLSMVRGADCIRTCPDWTLINTVDLREEGDPQTMHRKGWQPNQLQRSFPSRVSGAPGMPWWMHARFATEAGIPMLWVSIPHQGTATDAQYLEYIQDMAQQLSEHFDGVLIVEFSNETWNTLFPQGRAFRKIAVAEHGRPTMRSFVAGVHAARAFTAFQAAHSRPNQIRFAMMGHTFDSGAHLRGQLMGYEAAAGDVGPEIKIGGCGGYLPMTTEQNATWTAEDVLRGMRKSMPRLRTGLGLHADICAEYDLRFAIYEGGPSCIPGNAPWAAASVAAALHPDMADLCGQILDIWEASAVELGCWYNLCQGTDPKNGSFGVFTHMQDYTSPKHQGILDWILYRGEED
jgi:hypothetical protein